MMASGIVDSRKMTANRLQNFVLFFPFIISDKGTSIKRELQRHEEIDRERDIVRDGTEFQHHIQRIINLAKLRGCGFFGLIERNEIEDIGDIDIALELVDIDGDQDDVVVGKCLEEGDFRDQVGGMLAALFLDVVEGGDQEAD